MVNDEFYKKLKSFNKYTGTFNDKNYHSVPSDWYVVIADIEGSTFAIDNGRYKDVNLIGSACIGAVTALGDFPFVFGGDGASFIIPPGVLEVVKSELLRVKKSAFNRYSLKLRIGIVPVVKVLEEFDLKLAKFELAKNRYVAKFSGGGLSFADKLIKSDPQYLITDSVEDEESSFDRISCRWNPIQSQEGVILTLIVQTDDFIDYQNIQNLLEKVLGKNEKKLNPVKTEKMSYMKLKEIYENERKYEAHSFSFSSIKRKCEILLSFILFKPLRSFQPKFLSDYTLSMQQHSDYRKFDDVLRMVVDCTELQVRKILNTLDSMPSLKYGYSCSEYALMTCLVFGLNEGEHIHFIDGAEGGYTKAARMMKS